MNVKLHTDNFDTNGKLYNVKSFSMREGSSAITLNVIENAWTTREMTVPVSEVEWIDEVA